VQDAPNDPGPMAAQGWADLPQQAAELASRWADSGMDAMGWDGMGWDGMGWDGMGWDGMVARSELAKLCLTSAMRTTMTESSFSC